MTEAASVDIDTWTRAYAEERARQAGMPLRDWLRHFVATESGGEARLSDAAPGPAPAEDELFAAPSAGAVAEAEAPATIAAPASCATESRDWDDWGQDTSITRLKVVSVSARPAAAAIEEAPAEPAEMVTEAPMAAELPDADDNPALRLDGIEGALRQVCADIRAAEQATDSRFAAILPDAGRPRADAAAAASPQPIVGPNDDATKAMMAAIDSGLERIEAAAARQIADLRGEFTALFEELASRISQLEDRAAAPAEFVPAPVEAAAPPVEAAALPIEAAIEAGPAATVDDEAPTPVDPAEASGLFDEFAARFGELESQATPAEPSAASPVLGASPADDEPQAAPPPALGAASQPPPAEDEPAATPANAGLTALDVFGEEPPDGAAPRSVPLAAALAAPAALEMDEDPFAPPSGEARAEAAPPAISYWDEPTDAEAQPDRPDGDSEMWSQDARALAAFSAAHPDSATSSRKKSGFAWLGFLTGKAA